MADLDEEIQRAVGDSEGSEESDSEEQRLEDLQARDQQERMRRTQIMRQRTQPLKNQAKEALKQAGKEWAKQKLKQTLTREAIIATSPYWGTALLIIGAICLVLFLVIAVPVIACNSNYYDGLEIAGLKLVIAAIPGDICAALDQDQEIGYGDGGGGAAGGWNYEIDIVLTSAYRPGALTARGTPSAHGRGEAFDVALRNPTVPKFGTDPRIDALVEIGKSLGFVEPTGNTINEYSNPAENATGGHVHIEFNSGQCPGPAVTNPPSDLVSLVGKVPIDGASRPEVRACLEPFVLQFFELAGASDLTP